MILFIPTVGTDLRLEQDWEVPIHAERRNRMFLDRIGAVPPGAYVGGLHKPDGWGYPEFPVLIPKGTILKIDRIYIRKGMEDFDSITFYATFPDQKTKKPKKDRFWVKLQDANGIEVTVLDKAEKTG